MPPDSESRYLDSNFTCGSDFSSGILFFKSIAAGGGRSSKA
jgi:hypothetical protein